MLSFWEKESLITYDIIIIGAGITGLSSAISILEKNPKLSVAIFEAGILPSGASTRNAGFACFGSLSELMSDEKSLGTDKMLQLVQDRWEGLRILRERLGDNNLEFFQLGGYELVFDSINFEENAQLMNQKLNTIFNTSVFRNATSELKNFGFNKKYVKQLIYNPYEGQIHTGKMMKALANKATCMGITIYTNSRVKSLTPKGVIVGEVEFKSNQTLICTNAFTKSLLPKLLLKPGRGQVCITKPIKNLNIKGIFHYDEGYYYFRNIDNRILFGGGRNQDFQNEESTEIKINDKIQIHLIDELKSKILPSTPFEIDLQWSGIMALGDDKFPILKRVNERTVVAAKLGGIGIALGSKLGKAAAELTLN